MKNNKVKKNISIKWVKQTHKYFIYNKMKKNSEMAENCIENHITVI